MLNAASSQEHLDLLTRMSATIAPKRYMADIVRLIAGPSIETPEPKVCELWLLEEDERTLTLQFSQGFRGNRRHRESVNVGEGIVGKVALSKETRVTPNVLEDPDFDQVELAQREGLGSLLSVPLSAQGKVIGVINYYTHHTDGFNPKDEQALVALAESAAQAIRNAESMARSTAIRKELESRKLVEQATDVLSTQWGMSRTDARHWLRQRSTDTRKSTREVAAAVLLIEEPPSKNAF